GGARARGGQSEEDAVGAGGDRGREVGLGERGVEGVTEAVGVGLAESAPRIEGRRGSSPAALVSGPGASMRGGVTRKLTAGGRADGILIGCSPGEEQGAVGSPAGEAHRG